MIDPGYDPKHTLTASEGETTTKKIVGNVLITTSVNKPSPRYYLDPDNHHHFWLDKEFKTGKHDLRDYGMKKIFLNILEKSDRYFHVKLFLKDGQTQEAYLPTYYDDAIRIHGMDLLFDGRFNV